MDYKQVVRDGYDRCAPEYMKARERERADLDGLLERLPPNSRVLDLGCGSGIPVARTLARDHSVVGVDFSRAQLALARENVPGATFIRADLATIDFTPASFDAVVAFYVIFHLPRDDQLRLLGSIAAWLKPGGLFLATLSKRNEAAYTEDFFGIEMFWTNFALDEYIEHLHGIGFELVEGPRMTSGFNEDQPPEEHPLVLVRKR